MLIAKSRKPAFLNFYFKCKSQHQKAGKKEQKNENSPVLFPMKETV